MDTDTDLVSCFVCLDELVQVIYQGSSRFVLVSGVDETSWSINLGLSGSEGRWWRGTWNEKDIQNNVPENHRKSSRLLETFAEQLSAKIVQGELYVENWSVPVEKGAEIKLTLGGTSEGLVSVALTELSPEEAASYATKVFTEIALQARSRGCKLHPSPYELPAPTAAIGTFHKVAPPVLEDNASAQGAAKPTTPRKPSSSRNDVEQENDMLRAELAELKKDRSPPSKRRKASNSTGTVDLVSEESATSSRLPEDPRRKQTPATSKAAKASARPSTIRKGASLANPNQKARKYRPVEFGDD